MFCCRRNANARSSQSLFGETDAIALWPPGNSASCSVCSIGVPIEYCWHTWASPFRTGPVQDQFQKQAEAGAAGRPEVISGEPDDQKSPQTARSLGAGHRQQPLQRSPSQQCQGRIKLPHASRSVTLTDSICSAPLNVVVVGIPVGLCDSTGSRKSTAYMPQSRLVLWVGVTPTSTDEIHRNPASAVLVNFEAFSMHSYARG